MRVHTLHVRGVCMRRRVGSSKDKTEQQIAYKLSFAKENVRTLAGYADISLG